MSLENIFCKNCLLLVFRIIKNVLICDCIVKNYNHYCKVKVDFPHCHGTLHNFINNITYKKKKRILWLVYKYIKFFFERCFLTKQKGYQRQRHQFWWSLIFLLSFYFSMWVSSHFHNQGIYHFNSLHVSFWEKEKKKTNQIYMWSISSYKQSTLQENHSFFYSQFVTATINHKEKDINYDISLWPSTI